MAEEKPVADPSSPAPSNAPPTGAPSGAPNNQKAPAGATQSSNEPKVRYFDVNKTLEAELEYNSRLPSLRNVEKPLGRIASITQLVKGALGAGIMSSHVAFMHGGLLPSFALSIILGAFVIYSFYKLGLCAKICCRRSAIPTLTYPDVAEAAFALSSNKCLRRISPYIRYSIDITIGFELFGSCAVYQLMVAHTIKQLVEDDPTPRLDASIPGYPSLRMYMLMMAIPFMLISMVRHLKLLASFSLVGNVLVLICIISTIYYSMTTNPKFESMTMVTSFSGAMTFIGMIVFSMSCVGVVVPVENNLKRPDDFKCVIITGVTIICVAVTTTAFFGYNAYREKSKAPITLNFPMTVFPKILKGVIAANIYATHGINFWVPFNLVYAYLKKCHKPEKHVMMEYIYRACFCVGVTTLGIIFPDVSKVMSFLGCCCIVFAAFVMPNLMELVLCWERPGLGPFKWRLIRAIILLVFSILVFFCGSAVSIKDLVSLFTG